MTLQNLKFMQLTMSPLEHVTFMCQKRYNNETYWARIPTYVISRCPLCSASYTGLLDIHSLYDWSTFDWDLGRGFFTEKYEQVGCDHRLAVQKFVNLEGHIPSELKGYDAQLHVPFVMPFLVPGNLRSPVAVIHSFVICRLEDEKGQVFDYVDKTFRAPLKTAEEMMSKEHKFRKTKPLEEMSLAVKTALEEAVFVPRYTAYAVTYYAQVKDHQKLVDRRMKPQIVDMQEDSEYEPVWLASMGEMRGSRRRAFDLAYWVEQEKLQWLDLESPDLPLKSGPVEDFPYVNIQFDRGNRYRMQF
jgi:hypothetical protein